MFDDLQSLDRLTLAIFAVSYKWYPAYLTSTQIATEILNDNLNAMSDEEFQEYFNTVYHERMRRENARWN